MTISVCLGRMSSGEEKGNKVGIGMQQAYPASHRWYEQLDAVEERKLAWPRC